MKKVLLLMLIGLLSSVTSCVEGENPLPKNAGITEAGNPPDAKPDLRLIKGHLASPCPVVRILSRDSADLEKEAKVSAECRFELQLKAGKVWDLRLVDDKGNVAAIEFKNGPEFAPAAFYFVGRDERPLDFGLLEVKENKGSVAVEPSRQSDADRDGLTDFDDPDDDNDGILDRDEADCDRDGIIDDYDLKNVGC